jgi:hypothetical protein
MPFESIKIHRNPPSPLPAQPPPALNLACSAAAKPLEIHPPCSESCPVAPPRSRRAPLPPLRCRESPRHVEPLWSAGGPERRDGPEGACDPTTGCEGKPGGLHLIYTRFTPDLHLKDAAQRPQLAHQRPDARELESQARELPLGGAANRAKNLSRRQNVQSTPSGAEADSAAAGDPVAGRGGNGRDDCGGARPGAGGEKVCTRGELVNDSVHIQQSRVTLSLCSELMKPARKEGAENVKNTAAFLSICTIDFADYARPFVAL